MKKEIILSLIIVVLMGTGIIILFSKSSEVQTVDEENSIISEIQNDMDNFESNDESQKQSAKKVLLNPYVELVSPSGFVNTNEITLGELVGKKIILVDFLTYSCINCQRTFPYLNAWYEKYKDQGLEIIGIHTPEFAFEKNIENVREAMKKYGIMYPIVLDNNYLTWNAYGNRYWPRKYLIDIYGDIVYDHIGEGAYEETEMKIRELLRERSKVLGLSESEMSENLASKAIPTGKNSAKSPETYFGFLRNEYLANGTPGKGGEQNFIAPQSFKLNFLYLSGVWNIASEYSESVSNSSVIYKYNAKEVYIVAEADVLTEIEIWQDGKLVTEAGGDDLMNGILNVKESSLYRIINNNLAGEHTLEMKVKSGKVRLYAFTFG